VSDAYRALNAVNWSTLKHIGRSPLHYRHALEAPQRAQTPAMLFGSLVHALLFEPHTISARYHVGDVDRRTKAGKADYEAITAAGLSVVKPPMYDRAVAVSSAIRMSSLVGNYFINAQHELPVTWTHPGTGIVCKGKVDWTHPGTRTLLDLKTSRDIGVRAFGRASASMGYVGQLGGMYRDACRYGLGWEPARILIVAVESDAPHDVAVYQLDSQAIEHGEATVNDYLARLAECRRDDRWPGAHPDVEVLDVPGWLYGDGGDMTITYDDTDTPEDF
jgi:exodeoxyribonuclease VIII